MRHWKSKLGLLLMTFGLAGCADPSAGPDNVFGGVSIRPPEAAGLEMAMPENTIYMFEDADFNGDLIRKDSITAAPQGAVQPLSDDDSVTSVRWNLPPGAVVLLTQHEDGSGDRVAIWGQGQTRSVSPWKFNDDMSGWAWYNVGGLAALGSTAPLPPGASSTIDLIEGTIEMFRDRGFKGDMRAIPAYRSAQMGTISELPGELASSVSSLRWNLPAGTMVILHENADGTGRQLPIWGHGQYEMVPWSFNDRVSRWSWYQLGAPVMVVPVPVGGQ